ncbi:Putative cytokinin riboside 5'-monophosphate phosphoribohydrolase [Paraconexibacter sp. AEG42_29]|uniref:Cytokinin riboside 5'-monophosphate phosphoribohydrolase n=1 Tax=Paraconexibacter sp. AEG42_29 TaxID=2997339 RepID=A0AAU7AYS0_9ACTN
MTDLRRICVYAASSPGPSPAYVAAAADLGRTLAASGIGVVYGGGRAGLMGALADATLAAGGEVTGIIPDFLDAREATHRGVTHLHVVGSMHERKTLMAERADAFIALPGGIGTLEELVEAMTWWQLNLVPRPMGLLDVDGFWAPFTGLLDHLVAHGFMPQRTRAMLREDTSAGGLLAQLQEASVPPAPE